MRSFAALKRGGYPARDDSRRIASTRGDGTVGRDRHRLRDIALCRVADPLSVGTTAQVVDILVVQRLEMRLHARGSCQVGGRGLDLRNGYTGKAQHGQDEKKRSHEASLPFRTWPKYAPVASPSSNATAPFTRVALMPSAFCTSRRAPPGRSFSTVGMAGRMPFSSNSTRSAL